jgi:diguanylate cyclase (GGDEF)-like protein/PAS domain S-box-containing protein
VPCELLLVTPDEELLRGLRAALGAESEIAEGIVCVSDPAEALRRIADVPPTAVIGDARTPASNGIVLAKALVGEHPGLPVVLFVNSGDDERKGYAFEAGATDVLALPLVGAEVRTRLRIVTNMRQMRRGLDKSVEALHTSHERFELAARGANDAIWDWDVQTGSVYFSPRWWDIVGGAEESRRAGINEWFGRLHPDDRERTITDIKKHMLRRTPNFESEHRLQNGDGGYTWVLARGAAVWGDDARPTRVAGSIRDITQRKDTELRLTFDATHDLLTRLFNRRHLMSMLETAVHAAIRYDYNLSLVLCDLDKFKDVNERYSHQAGDMVLAAFGDLVREQLRIEDIAGRYGGDEFTFIFPHANAEEATVVAERIRAHFAAARVCTDEGDEISCSATFGIAELKPAHPNEKALLAAADEALHKAKRAGRNRVGVAP